MKYLITLALVAMLSVVALAELEVIHIEINDVSTNAAPIVTDKVTNGVPVFGLLEAIQIDVGGYTSPTIDVDIATASGVDGQSRTLYSADDVTADTVVYPRVNATTTGGTLTNEPARIPIAGKVHLHAYDADVTNATAHTIDAYIYVWK